MKSLALSLLLAFPVASSAQTINPSQVRGIAIVQNPTGDQPVKILNGVLNPTLFSGSDIGAQIASAIASTGCTNGCTLSFPLGTYPVNSSIEITKDHVRIVGNGAKFVGSSSALWMFRIHGDYDEMSGVDIATNNSTYGIIATEGINQKITNNHFGGNSGLYIAVAGSPSGARVAGNTFDGETGCASQNDVSVFDSAHVEVSSNQILNTCGFAIETSASNQVIIHGNNILQDTQQQSIAATAGQTSFVFNWPSTVPKIQRVWMQVNGVPTTATSVTYTSALVTTVVMSAQTAGAVVTALGWTALENIQVNSQSFNVIVDGNTVSGAGDAGIDVVSDYHMVTAGSITATNNQRIFAITSGGTLSQAVAVINGRVAAPDVATVTNVGNVYTITLVSAVPAGTVVTLSDWILNFPGSVSSDYPGSVTIQNNVVKEAASSCIAPEIAAVNVVIQGNVVQDCGMGVATAAFSSGIFTGNAIGLSVKNNTISNTRAVPTMRAAISVQCSGCETGDMEKTQSFSGNTYQGTFSSGKLYIPALSQPHRQSGIDVEGTTLPYPEQVNLDQPWSVKPPDSHYFTYACTGAGMTRTTASVIGGIAAGTITSGTVCNITPSNQIFFFNSLMKVTFWAKAVSGTPAVEIFSNYTDPPQGTTQSVGVSIVSTFWKQYSIYMPTTGFDQPPAIFIRVDGTSGVMTIQNIFISAVPFATGPTSANGTNQSGIFQNFFSDTIQAGTLNGSGKALACLDALGNFYRGTTTTCP